VAISVSVNARSLAAFLRRAEISLGEKNKLLNEIADLELSQTRQRFIQQIDPSGTKWKQTLRQKKNPSAKILRKSGVLFNSLAKKIIGNSAFIGTNVSYALIHQTGGSFKVGNRNFKMPKRQFIGTNDQTILNIDRAIRNLINRI
jgi:phage virion morphogenesis protein